MAIEKWQVGQVEQLGLGLDLDSGLAAVGEGRAETGEQVAQRKEAARRAFELRFAEGTLEAAWLDDYLMLRTAGWPWEAAIYVAWAASPKRERWPKSLEELATTCLGLTGPRRIFEWRRKNPAIDETVAMLQAAPLLAHRRDIYEALITSASQPDYKGFNDRKLALELLGDYTPQSKLRLVRATPTSEEEMSDDELRGLLGEVSRQQSAFSGQQEPKEQWEDGDLGEGREW